MAWLPAMLPQHASPVGARSQSAIAWSHRLLDWTSMSLPSEPLQRLVDVLPVRLGGLHVEPPQTILTPATPKRMMPRMSVGVPSPCVPCQCHSVPSVSPSWVTRINSPRKSGTAANSVAQFLRACVVPVKARLGWQGYSLR